MNLEISIGVSNRHIHLTEETYNQLFDEPLTIAKELSQPGGFASNQFVTIKTENGEIENVRIVRIEGDRSATLDAYIKTSQEGFTELHIDRDEANALLIEKTTKAILYK